jgi:hypothetical protein
VLAPYLLLSLPSIGPKWEDGEVRRHFALGATVLEQGLGVLVRGRYEYVGFEVSGGGNPYLIPVTGGCNRALVGFPPHATASLLFFFNGHERFFQSGLRAAGVWDRVFGFGGQLGYMAELSFTELIALQIGAGVQVYPKGEDRPLELAREKCGPGASLFPLSTFVRPYFGVNVLFYLL